MKMKQEEGDSQRYIAQDGHLTANSGPKGNRTQACGSLR